MGESQEQEGQNVFMPFLWNHDSVDKVVSINVGLMGVAEHWNCHRLLNNNNSFSHVHISSSNMIKCRI